MTIKKIRGLLCAAILTALPAFADQQTINIGATPNDGTGDPLRTAFQKANTNFTDLYNIKSNILGGTNQTMLSTNPAVVPLMIIGATNAQTNLVTFQKGTNIVSGISSNGNFRAPPGTAASVAIGQHLDGSNGIYFPNTSNSVAISIAGLPAIYITNGPTGLQVIIQSNNASNPNATLVLPSGGAINMGASQIWDNYGHGGGGDNSEEQWSFNFMSFNPASFIGHVQFGLRASTGPQNFFTAAWGGTSNMMNSSMFGYQYFYNYPNGDYIDTYVSPLGTSGTGVWHLTQPTGNPNANQNDTNAADMIQAISSFGTEAFGQYINDRLVGVCASNGTFNVDLGHRTIDVLVNGAGTIAITNTTYLSASNSLITDLMINGGLSSANLTWSPIASINLIWENEAGTASAPSSVAFGKMLHVILNTEIRDNKTNCFARAIISSYTQPMDAAASSFFTANGTLLAAESNAVNFLAGQSKAHAYFSKLILIDPLVGANSNNCSFNLVNPANYRIAWHGTTSTNFTTLGVYGDGSTMWADLSGLDPSTQLSSPNSSMFGVWVRGTAQPSGGANVDFYGVVGNNNDRWGTSVGSSTTMAQVGMNNNVQGNGSINVGSSFIGFLGQNRTAASAERDYVNSLPGATQSSAVVALPNGQDVGVWARQGGGADHFCNANLTAIVCGQNMTAINMQDMIADLALFNQLLGR